MMSFYSKTATDRQRRETLLECCEYINVTRSSITNPSIRANLKVNFPLSGLLNSWLCNVLLIQYNSVYKHLFNQSETIEMLKQLTGRMM